MVVAMTDPDRRSFMGSLAALFAGFRIKGTPEHELIKATDDFLEDPECKEEEYSESSSSSGTTELSSTSIIWSCSCTGRGCSQYDRCVGARYKRKREAELQ